jgi:hypothetical protein
MEMSQGNSLYSYFKQTKCQFFLLQNQRSGEQILSGGRGYQWAEGGCGERV